MARLIFLAWIAILLQAQEYTLGVGVYPGDPKENFGPLLQVDSTTYRNLALHRPAYHSSSYDYNLTAQLITDGIKESTLPRWLVTTTSQQGVLPKNEREYLLDGNWVTSVDLSGAQAWVQLELAGGATPLEVDRIDVDGSLRAPGGEPEIWACVVSASDDGATWREVGRSEGMARPSGDIRTSVKFASPSRFRYYRLTFSDPRARTWRVNEVALFRDGQPVHAGGPYHFHSAWKSAGAGQEWVYVDLGAICTFDRVTLSWVRRASQGALQVSDDASHWQQMAELPASGSIDDLKLATPSKGRYVRVLMQKPAAPDGYVLSELEVFGRGGPVPRAKPAPAATASHIELSGGAWRVQRDSLVQGDGAALSKPRFDDSHWIPATVPGTVLVSYLNSGALPDPNYADNQLMISDSFFQADFWYRDVFTVPAGFSGRQVWLNFDGINWKADVFLNGEKLGRIEGAFMRGRFDATKKLAAGRNVLAVRVLQTATPGSVKEATIVNTDKNGGAPGADNPSFHAAIGWDWIPTIRGRETGIWNRVYLEATGMVTVEDPLVTSVLPLPDTSRATVTIETTLRNHANAAVSGTLRGRFGDIPFSVPVTLAAAEAKSVKHTLDLKNPKLWWPAGYGAPNLYPVRLQFEAGPNVISDVREFQAGVRQFTYSEEGRALRMWINGRRFIPKGGNWGFGESLLRYRGREYDAAIRYHAEMNFNMIRDWVGQIGEDEFYQACDRHGIVVWQDFWLANPWDGPNPDDESMFLRNVKDYVLRIRSHPSIGLYVGRNEGYPPKTIDDGIRATLAAVHPDLHYIPSSADDVVSGHGPYQEQSPRYYFTQRATSQFHSEMGMPNIVTLDSLRLFLPESALWPQNLLWGIHDFTNAGAQNGASFRARIEKNYGPVDNVADWVWLAQFENYQGYRAMFEAQSKNRMGLLIWMSHPCWPSLVWQTYDYYLDPTAGYFGAKKASEPLHIQWNPANDTVEVVNYSAGRMSGLTARVQVMNSDGAVKWEKSAALDSDEDTTQAPIKIEYPGGLTPVHFLRLELRQGERLVSENFYWRGTEEENYRALRTLPKVAIEAATTSDRRGDRWLLTTTLSNRSQTPALMVRLKAVRDRSGDRILPAIYSDGYVALMPGEARRITTELRDADTRGEKPRIVVEGFNVQ